MSFNDGPRCSKLTRNGKPCQAVALPGQDTCCFHSPRYAKERDRGRKLGALSKLKAECLPPTPMPKDGPDLSFGTSKEIAHSLALVANWTLRGHLRPVVAQTVTAICAQILKALQNGDIEDIKRGLGELQIVADKHQQLLGGCPTADVIQQRLALAREGEPCDDTDLLPGDSDVEVAHPDTFVAVVPHHAGSIEDADDSDEEAPLFRGF